MAKSTDEMLNKIDTKLDDMSDAIHKIDKEVALQKAAFDDHVDNEKVRYQQLERMNDILQANTDSLKEHMHRTDLLETLVAKMDARLSPLEIEKLEAKAVNKYKMDKLKKWGKYLGLAATAIGILAGLKPFLLKLLSL